MDRDDAMLNYLQERLSPDERAAFEVEMAADASLAAEVDLMRSVRAELADSPGHEQADEVWERLSAEIDTAPGAAPVAANDNRQPWRQILQYAAVAVLAIAAWQVTVVPRLGAPEEGFRAVSEDTAAIVLQVKFVDSATLGEIAEVLTPLGGTLSDGPSALGIVQVSFADSDTREQAFEALEANDDLVEFVSR